MSRELEDIFREGLDSQRIAPSSGTWGRIKNRLWWSEIITTISGASSQPSASVWRQIHLRLWLSDFIKFNALKFNMYYLAGILTGAALMIAAYPTEVKISDQLADFNNITIIKNQNVLGMNTETMPAELPESNYNVGQTNDNSKSVITTNMVIADNDLSQPITLEPFVEEGLNQMPLISTDFLNTESLEVNMFGDSSINDWTGKPIRFERFSWSADFFVQMSMASSLDLKLKNDENAMFKGSLPNIQACPGRSAGLMLNYEVNNFMFQGGLAYSQQNYMSDYNQLTYKSDTVVVTWVQEGGTYDYDTTWVLNLDSLINGNPVYVPIVDSVFVHSIDTFSVAKPVTKKEFEEKTAISKISYAEFPLSAGYSFVKGKFECKLKLMFIPGLLVYSTGEITNPYSSFGSYSVTNEIHRKWLFSAGGAMELNYKPTARLGLYIEPFVRQNLNSVFRDDFPYQLKASSWGCKMGIRYYIK
ncbi:MAG: hypothetical protein CVU05_07170 [Bacteroidetes bacterium HGW-Bacteroidetes-21]|nr:MAG: hypothetical protein CVU05_07170 [Bacteroidetes bacterium HGW-Bacteroidetes-21]